MNRTISTALIRFTTFAIYTFLIVSTSHADAPSYGMPSAIKPTANYLLFLHNYYVETKGPDGDCKYFDILKAFADKGFIVISEIRPKDASVSEWAKKTVANIQAILDAGVPQENITVAGHSKGGVIAIQIASLLGKPKVNYVILAGCGIEGLASAYPDFSQLKGNFLSVYATSDKVAGSCSTAFSQAKQDVSIKEIALENAAGHQLFFKPTDVWFEPVVSWLKQK
jgi:predicted esterase